MANELGFNNRITSLTTNAEVLDVFEQGYNINLSTLNSTIEINSKPLWDKPNDWVGVTSIEAQTEVIAKDLAYNIRNGALCITVDVYEKPLAPETPLITKTHIEAQTEFSSEELEFAIRTTITNTNIEKNEPLLFNDTDAIVEFTHIEAQIETYEKPLYRRFNIYVGRSLIQKIYIGAKELPNIKY